MTTILSELHYLPPIEVFAYYARADTIFLEACEHYQKRSYRNRCHIVGANGVQRLSIFLEKGKNSKMPVKEVKLAFHQAWPQQHWRSLRSAYGNAPFFLHYSDAIEAVYKEGHQSLWAFNISLLKCVFELLQWDKRIHETEVYQKEYPSPIVDIRKTVLPEKFIDDVMNSIGTSREYPQVFRERHGFIGNLSILDLLFCMGPQCELYLRQFKLIKLTDCNRLL